MEHSIWYYNFIILDTAEIMEYSRSLDSRKYGGLPCNKFFSTPRDKTHTRVQSSRQYETPKRGESRCPCPLIACEPSCALRAKLQCCEGCLSAVAGDVAWLWCCIACRIGGVVGLWHCAGGLGSCLWVACPHGGRALLVGCLL